MSHEHDHEHHHHHEHGHDECCCHDHDHEHEHHEKTSIEEAGGCATGFTGSMNCFNADAEARFAKALITVGKWVEAEAGCLLGHIKAAIVKEDGSGITLNLTSMDEGVQHHGTLEPQEKVKFSFMSAVLDVDEGELKHRMYHAIVDSGLDIELDERAPCCCHEHGHEHHHHHEHDHGECHCHEHHHDHGHDECCCHGHHHDEECHCHEHVEECDVEVTGTFSDLKWEDVKAIMTEMGEVWEWIEKNHAIPGYVEVTLVPEKGDWVVLCMTEEDIILHKGMLADTPKAAFRIECAAAGVTAGNLKHRLYHAVKDMDIEVEINGGDIHHHEHDHGHEHHHEHGECCCHHSHDH